MKRSLVLRCLVVLVSLALACGNAHAALHLDAAHTESCPEQHAHHNGQTSHHHQQQHDKGLACCCDCMGCTSTAYIAPELTITPAELPGHVHYDALTAPLSSWRRCPSPILPDPAH